LEVCFPSLFERCEWPAEPGFARREPMSLPAIVGFIVHA